MVTPEVPGKQGTTKSDCSSHGKYLQSLSWPMVTQFWPKITCQKTPFSFPKNGWFTTNPLPSQKASTKLAWDRRSSRPAPWSSTCTPHDLANVHRFPPQWLPDVFSWKIPWKIPWKRWWKWFSMDRATPISGNPGNPPDKVRWLSEKFPWVPQIAAIRSLTDHRWFDRSQTLWYNLIPGRFHWENNWENPPGWS